ncbi:MAG: cadherin-like beta sandwich domain-containing protein, partial [Woeseiaceae bacterium]
MLYPQRYLKIFLIASIALWFTACGGGGTTPLSNNADLSDLSITVSQLDQAFQSSQLNYTASVHFLSNSIRVTATTADAGASLAINGVSKASATASDPVLLANGNNTITVIVTAEDGTSTQTYNLVVNRQSLAAFAERAYAKASNTETFDEFGFSVALSGDTLAIGTLREDSATTGVNS